MSGQGNSAHRSAGVDASSVLANFAPIVVVRNVRQPWDTAREDPFAALFGAVAVTTYEVPGKPVDGDGALIAAGLVAWLRSADPGAIANATFLGTVGVEHVRCDCVDSGAEETRATRELRRQLARLSLGQRETWWQLVRAGHDMFVACELAVAVDADQ